MLRNNYFKFPLEGEAASEVYMEDVFMSFRKLCRGKVNMSYQIRVFCQRLMGLVTFLFQKKARGGHYNCLLCENLSLSFHSH